MSDAVTDYGFINAKLRAKLGRMRDPALIEAMLRAKTLLEAVQVLRGTEYQHLAEAYDRTGDLQSLELDQRHHQISEYKEIMKYLKPSIRDFVSALLEKVEIENLKNAIRLWYGNNVQHRLFTLRAGYLTNERIVHDIDWEAIINGVSWHDVMLSLKATPYFQVASRFTNEDIERDGLFYFELELDKGWFINLNRATYRDLSRADRRIAEAYYGTDIDLKSILHLVRCGFYYKLPSDKLRDVVIPGGTIAGTPEVDEFIASDPADRDPIKLLRHAYPGIAKDITANGGKNISKETTIIEKHLDEIRSAEMKHFLVGDPFNLGILIAYFDAYKKRDSEIRALLFGKYFSWPEERIRSVMG